MKKNKKLIISAVFSASALFLSALSPIVSANTKVGMVTDTGGVNDQSFNQSAWEGLTRAKKELGVKVSFKESHQESDYKPNLEMMVDAGNKFVLGVGFTMGNSVLEAAKANPRTNFAVIDNSFKNGPKNLAGIVFKEQEGSFLVGYIAGKKTKTGKVGFIGGLDIPVITRFMVGFEAGVRQANPKAEIVVQYTNSFSDAALGKTIANGMYQRGVDIIFQAVGGAGEGVIESAKENKKWVIGVDRDQSYLAPKNVITSMIKRVDNASFMLVQSLLNKKFHGGKNIVLGLKENAVGISSTSSKHVSKKILKETELIKGLIISGKIKVPSSKKELSLFKPIKTKF